MAGQGPSEYETEVMNEADENARRTLKEKYAEYKKLSESVLESEPIPLGTRQIIRSETCVQRSTS